MSKNAAAHQGYATIAGAQLVAMAVTVNLSSIAHPTSSLTHCSGSKQDLRNR